MFVDPVTGEVLTARSPRVVLEELVAVPIDVGKHTAAAMVLDFTGAVLAKPFDFDLDREGIAALVRRVEGVLPNNVRLVRAGIEAAGHYHLGVVAPGVLPSHWEQRVLNAGHVAMQRKANGQRGVKTDAVDLQAIADLLLAGRGTPPPAPQDPVVALCGWVAHRRRRSLARRQTIQQLTTQVDRCFPGLGRAVSSVALTRSGRLVISELPDPTRLVRLGPHRLRTYAANRGVRMTRPLAERIVAAARSSLPVPSAEIARRILAADLVLLEGIEGQLAEADAAIEALLPQTPFAVLTTVPGWGPSRVATYGAAVGEPSRWPSHKQLYRASGLTPRVYESAGKRRDGRITREGSVLLRCALVDLGLGLWHQEPAARRYAQGLRDRGKPGAVITIALANRANRVAFAMVRDQTVYDPDAWRD